MKSVRVVLSKVVNKLLCLMVVALVHMWMLYRHVCERLLTVCSNDCDVVCISYELCMFRRNSYV